MAAQRAIGPGRALLLALLVLAPALCLAQGPRRLAVLVGANRGHELRAPLRHAARDAEKMSAVLSELGGVSPDDIVLLTDAPTRKDVIDALRNVEVQAATERARGRDTALFFFYSGHSSPEALELSGTRLKIAQLRDYLKRSQTQVRLAVLDACHSGVAVRLKGGLRTRRPQTLEMDGALSAKGYAILTSSAAGEASQESDEVRGSFFTHHLVSGLRGAADSDGDRTVTLAEAYRYAYARTVRHTAMARVAQHPNVDLKLKGGTDVALTRLPSDAARIKVVGQRSAKHKKKKKRRAQWIIYAPDAGQVVAEIDERPDQTVSLVVPPGELEVYRRSTRTVRRGRVTAKAGQEVILDKKSLEEVSMTAYLYKGRSSWMMGAHVGIQTLGSEDARAQAFGPAPMFGLNFGYRDLGVFGLDLGLDLSFSHISQNLVFPEGGITARVTEFVAGVSLMYRFDFDSLSLSVGPRVALLVVHRDPQVADADTMATVAIGGTIGVWYRFSELVSVGFDARVSYVNLRVNDTLDRDQVLVETQAAAAFHF